jgi:hypothetical protein
MRVSTVIAERHYTHHEAIAEAEQLRTCEEREHSTKEVHEVRRLATATAASTRGR